MENSARRRLGFLSGALVYLIFLCFFYWKYVPLVRPFQLVLLPVLLAAVALTVARVELGILFFVLAFPLINGLPYLFGIYEDIPHAPAALVLFLAFFLGVLLHAAFSSAPARAQSPLLKPLGLLFWVIVISAVITSLRYTNFFPFLAADARELAVNVNEVRAGGAVMSVLFNFLNYVTGFAFLVILLPALKSKDYVRKVLLTVSFSTAAYLVFAIVQRLYSPALGNTPFWVRLGRINATFKDPNSFGVVLSASLPLFLGLAIAFKGRWRVWFSALILLGLAVFPFTGSRSGFLGLGFALLVFFLLSLRGGKIKHRNRAAFAVALSLLVILAGVSFFVFYQKSNLYQRMESSLNFLGKEESFSQIFTQKLEFWRVAVNMVNEYPLTGVGLGAYIIEMPNYLRQLNLPFRHTDSAENYVLQAVSELGLIGLFLFFWVFLEIYRGAKRSWSSSPFQGREKFILIGAISGIAAILVGYLFHSYIGSFEVKYFFWLLVALVFFRPNQAEESASGAGGGTRRKVLSALAVLAFASVHLGNSLHSLSIEGRREKFGWAQNFGFYGPERDVRGFRFRWARKNAGLVIENGVPLLTVPMLTSHPDAEENPVRVKVFLSDRYFRRKKLFREVVLRTREWTEAEFILPASPEKNTCLIFEADREWQPLRHSGVPDPRWLGLGMGDYWFTYPRDLPAERITGIQRIPAGNWEGKSKDRLSAEGRSTLKFRTAEKDVAFRLRIRGQKAFGLGPHIVVRLGDRVIGRTVIAEEGWTLVVFEARAEEGENVLSVEFTNDVYRPDLGQDRNVFLGETEILSLRAKPGSS
jgi:hypothetical protein